MDKPLLSYTLWLQLSSKQKAKMVRLFNIPRTGEVIVHVGEMMNGNIGGAAKQDGHNPADLYAVTCERMVELLSIEHDDDAAYNFYELYQAVIDNLSAIYAEQYPNENSVVPTPVETPAPVTSEPETTEEFVPRDPEELLKKIVKDVSETVPPEEVLSTAAHAVANLDVTKVTQPKPKKDAKTKTTKTK